MIIHVIYVETKKLLSNTVTAPYRQRAVTTAAVHQVDVSVKNVFD